MTERDFLAGWAMLMAQSYASYLTVGRDTSRMQAQMRIWQDRFGQEDREVWIKAVNWWIDHEAHWPTVPGFREVLRRFRPKPTETGAPRLGRSPHIGVSTTDLIRFAQAHGITVFEAVRRWEDVAAWKLTG